MASQYENWIQLLTTALNKGLYYGGHHRLVTYLLYVLLTKNV